MPRPARGVGGAVGIHRGVALSVGALAELFEQVLLDDAVRDMLDRDPEAVLSRFELSLDERELLRSRGPGVLDLLGRVVAAPAPAVDPAPADDGNASATLATSSLGLAVQPVAIGAGDPAPVQWSVTLLQDPRGPAPEGAVRLRVDLHADLVDGGIAVHPAVDFVDLPDTTAPPIGTWQLTTTGDTVAACRDAVRAADPEARLDALLALLDAMGAP